MTTVAFLGDFLDRGARPKRAGDARDYWTLVPAGIAAAAGSFDAAGKLAEQLFGLPASALPLVVLSLSAVLCAKIICSQKPLRPSGFQPSGAQPEPSEYAYAQLTRQVAKVALIIVLVVIPFRAANVVDAIIPLPTTIYGFLYEAQGGDPVKDALVRVTSVDGADITKGTSLTDSRGFYIVETSRRPTRRSRLDVSAKGCNSPIRLSLLRTFESRDETADLGFARGLHPLFRHTVDCGGKR